MNEYRIRTEMRSGEVADVVARCMQIPGYEVFPNFDNKRWEVHANGKRTQTSLVVSVGLYGKTITTHNGVVITSEQEDQIRKSLVTSI